MTASEPHSSASVKMTGCEVGWIEAPMVDSKLGLLMLSVGKIHRESLVGQFSTMEQRPHEKPVLAAKGHMQYRWFRATIREQEVVGKEKM